MLPMFCDLRSNAKVLGTSCYKKGLECVFGRFLARPGGSKSAQKHVFYEGFVTFCWGMELTRKSSQIRSGRTVKAIDRTRHMIRSSLFNIFFFFYFFYFFILAGSFVSLWAPKVPVDTI